MISPIRGIRRSSVLLMIAAIAAAFPLGALAVHQFSDVPTSASYHDDVEALVDSGITSGCGGGKYCPSDPVTRAQMSQFLNRLGNLDGNSTPSVDAATLQGALPAVGVVTLDGSTTSTTVATLDSFTVTVPGPGTLYVQVAGDFWSDMDATSTSSVTDFFRWGICDAANSSASCGGTWIDTYTQDADNASNFNDTPGSARVRTVTVGAAGSRTFYLNAHRADSASAINTYNTYATVIFLPGTSTLSISSPATLSVTDNRQD